MGLQPDYKSLPESEIKFCTLGPRLMNEKKKGKQRQQEPDLLTNKVSNYEVYLLCLVTQYCSFLISDIVRSTTNKSQI